MRNSFREKEKQESIKKIRRSSLGLTSPVNLDGERMSFRDVKGVSDKKTLRMLKEECNII